MGVYVIITRCQCFAFMASIFRALCHTTHALWKSSLVTWKLQYCLQRNEWEWDTTSEAHLIDTTRKTQSYWFCKHWKDTCKSIWKINPLQSSITLMINDKDSIPQALKENKKLKKRKVLSYNVKYLSSMIWNIHGTCKLRLVCQPWVWAILFFRLKH